MQPLDRYLSNLAKLLPADQREDILRELSEDIHSEYEDKESELGRPLIESEQLEILKRRGNPLQVAAGYAENKGTLAFGPQLIGPVLFPFYVRVLTFNLGLTFLIVGAIFAAISLAGQPIHFADLFSSVILQLFIQLAAVTLIFALVEKHFEVVGLAVEPYLHFSRGHSCLPFFTVSVRYTRADVEPIIEASLHIAQGLDHSLRRM